MNKVADTAQAEVMSDNLFMKSDVRSTEIVFMSSHLLVEFILAWENTRKKITQTVTKAVSRLVYLCTMTHVAQWIRHLPRSKVVEFETHRSPRGLKPAITDWRLFICRARHCR